MCFTHKYNQIPNRKFYHNITPFTVIYEDFVLHYEETALRILDWLNICYPENLVFGPRRLLKQADSVSENWVQKYRVTKQNKQDCIAGFTDSTIQSNVY